MKLHDNMTVGKVVGACLFAALATGCVWVDDTQDLETFADASTAVKSRQIDPLPITKPYESFVYKGVGMRNPFIPLVAITDPVRPAPDAQDETQSDTLITQLNPDILRPKSYLERYSIEDLKMVGTISSLESEGFIALLNDPKGEIHQVIVGDYLGRDHGRVVSVTDYLIDIIEIVSNGRGGWMYRQRAIQLPEPQL